MKKLLVFGVVLCGFVFVVAEEATAEGSNSASAIEQRLKTVEENQAALQNENKQLKEELAAVKAKPAVEEGKATEVKKEEKKVVDFTPYGFVELIGWMTDAKFKANDLQLSVEDEAQSTTGLTARNSRLGLKIAFPRLEAVKLTSTLEIDFFGTAADTGFAESNAAIRLRQAFFDLSKTWDKSTLGFKIGQTWSPATPLVLPALINPGLAWGMGNTWQRMPLAEVYFTQKFAETFAFTAEIAAARAMSGNSINKNSMLELGIDSGDASHIPQLQGQLSLKGSFAGIDLTLAFAGAWGRESYKGGVTLPTKIKYVGGIVDMFFMNPALKLSHKYAELAGKFYYGQNLDVFGVFGGSLITTDIDATTKEVTGSQKALGYWVQATGKPLAGLSLNVGYGAEDPDEDQEGAKPVYIKNSTIWVSAFYTFFEQVNVGFQWAQVWTDKNTDTTLTGNSFMGSAKISF